MRKEDKKEKWSRKRARRPKARHALGKFGKWLFLLLILGQNWRSVNDAAGRPQRRAEAMVRMQQEVQVKEGRGVEDIPQRWRQPKREDWTWKKKEARVVRCALLNGSAWSAEKKYMRRYKGKCDIFFGIEHRMRKEENEDQFH